MKTINHIIIFLFSVAFLFSCQPSPEAKGRELAEQMNENNKCFLTDRKKVEAEFVEKFDPSKFTRRDEAIEEYNLQVGEVDSQYQTARAKILQDYSATETDIMCNDFDKLSQYKTAYQTTLDIDLENKALAALQDLDYPLTVLAKVALVIPSKPDAQKIIEDLASESITEGLEKPQRWYSEELRWELCKYTIKDFDIEEVLRDNSREYVIIATMRLDGDHNAFDARVKISYTLPAMEDWTMEYVTSLGVSIVRTYKYDDLVYYDIKDDGWGGVNALYITNKSNVDLVVGVDYVTNRGPHRTSVIVHPNEPTQVGGTFCGGSVKSYEIGFVERY